MATKTERMEQKQTDPSKMVTIPLVTGNEKLKVKRKFRQKKAKVDEDEDDDIICEEDQSPVKKAKLAVATAEPSKEDDEIVCLE